MQQSPRSTTRGTAPPLRTSACRRTRALPLSGNDVFLGSIYAPSADLTMSGGGNPTPLDFQGACAVNTIGMNGHFNFHFDENLKRKGPDPRLPDYLLDRNLNRAWHNMRSLKIVNAKRLLFLFSALALSQSAPDRAGADQSGERAGRHQPGLDHGRHRRSGLDCTRQQAGGITPSMASTPRAAATSANNGETWLQTTVVGPGTISFWWQAYSEPDRDWLEFYVGSTLQARICGGGDHGPAGRVTGNIVRSRCRPAPMC